MKGSRPAVVVGNSDGLCKFAKTKSGYEKSQDGQRVTFRLSSWDSSLSNLFFFLVYSFGCFSTSLNHVFRQN